MGFSNAKFVTVLPVFHCSIVYRSPTPAHGVGVNIKIMFIFTMSSCKITRRRNTKQRRLNFKTFGVFKHGGVAYIVTLSTVCTVIALVVCPSLCLLKPRSYFYLNSNNGFKLPCYGIENFYIALRCFSAFTFPKDGTISSFE